MLASFERAVTAAVRAHDVRAALLDARAMIDGFGVLSAAEAIAGPVRLEIGELLAQAPRTVEVLAGEIHQSVANTSQHLQQLKRAQLVRGAREGLHVRYSLAGPEVARLVVQPQAVGAAHHAALDALTRGFFDDQAGLEPLDRDPRAARLKAGDLTLIDVRPAHGFAEGHLRGAISAPLSALEEPLHPPATRPHRRGLPPWAPLYALGRGRPAPARARLRYPAHRRLRPQPAGRSGRRMRAAPLRLGLRDNWAQFSLLVLVNALVGAMIGVERSILPAIAEGELQRVARTAIFSLIVVFGVSKARTNEVAGRWSDRLGRKRVLVAGWLAAAPVPFLLMWASTWSWVLAANLLRGVSQGLTWPTTVSMRSASRAPSTGAWR